MEFRIFHILKVHAETKKELLQIKSMIAEINESVEDLEYEVEEVLQKVKQKKTTKWKIRIILKSWTSEW